MKIKKVVGTYHTINQAIQKVEELKAQGYREDELFAVGKKNEDRVILQERTELQLLEMQDLADFEYVTEMEAGGIVLLVDTVSEDEPNDDDVAIEMDSRTEQGQSGEILDGQDEEQQAMESPVTMPRLNTKNL